MQSTYHQAEAGISISLLHACTCIYMEIHVFSTLAYENKKEKKGNQPNHDLDKETYIARDTWMPSLENWGGGLKIFCVHDKQSKAQDSFKEKTALGGI